MTYQILKGDTLSALAQKYKTDIPAIQKLNPNITDINKIYEGQSLNLPETPKPDPLAQITTDADKPSVVTSTSIDTEEQKKIADQAKKDQDDEANLIRLTRQKQIQDLQSSLAPQGIAPVSPDLTGEYTKLLGEKTPSGYSYGEMQMKVTELSKQKEETEAKFAGFKRTTPVGVSAGFAQGAISEEQQKVQDELDRINRELNTWNLQISNRNDVINTMMGLKKEDYTNATASYDKEFARNIQLYTSTMTSGNVEKDNARANLQIIQNQIQKGTIKYDNLDEATKNTIASLEDQAGMPRGWSQFIASNTEGELLYEGTFTDKNGQINYFSVNKDPETGAPVTTTAYIGQGKVPESENDEEKVVNDFMADVSSLVPDIDDNKITYEIAFKKLKTKWGLRGIDDDTINWALSQ